MTLLKDKYITLCNTSSDINEHLRTLKEYAQECDSVFETGVRGVVSSYAFLYGLAENTNGTNKRIFLNDIFECDIAEFISIAESNLIHVKNEWNNNLNLQFSHEETYDLTFIDTWHVYGQLKRELNKFSKITDKYMILHDTTVDGEHGETIRCQFNASEQSQQTGIPIDEINCGLWKAVEEFLQENSNWILHMRFTNNNGLTILKKIS